MKKIITSILSIAMLFSLFVLPVSAAGEDATVVFTPDKTVVNTHAGDETVTYTVSVKTNNPDVKIGSMEIPVLYPTGMNFESVDANMNLYYHDMLAPNGKFKTYTYSTINNTLLAAGASATRYISEETVLMSITVKIPQGTSGTLALDVNPSANFGMGIPGALGGTALTVNSVTTPITANNTAIVDASITPTTGTVDKYNATDLVIAKTDGSYNLNAIKNGATTLTPNVDYSISGNTVTFKADYLKTLAKGTATLTFDYNGGTDPTLILTVTADTSVDYDVDNGDITITDNGDGSVTIEQGGNSTNVSDECEIIIGGGTGNVINNGAENVTIDGNLTGNITTSNGGQTTVDGNITGNISTDGAGSDTIVKGDVTGDVGTSDGAKTDVDGKVTGDVTTDGQGSKTEVGNSIGGSTNNTNGGSTSSNTNNIGNGGTNTGNSNTSSSGGGGGSGVVTYKNSTSSSNNGAVTVSPTNAEAGKAVTVTVKPNSGYELNVLTVKDASGKTITTTKKSDTSYTYTMPDSAVTITATFKVEGSVSYNDVAASAWYYDAVSYVTEHNIMQGVGDNKFAPDSKTNRGMMVQILYNMEGKPAVNDSSAYADVASGQWYTDAVVWATGKGIVTGYGDNKFGPEDNVTNEQMLTILYRYATYKGYTIANGNGYTDNAQPSDWAKTFVNWGYGNGMISSQTSSAPTGASIRCQIAHALYVFCENVAK